MILIKIKPHDKTPIYRQIIDRIIDLIEKRSLEKGENLPSSRELAEKLGIDRTTVYRAYAELNALGYTESRPGSYTKVRKRPEVGTQILHSHKGIITWDKKSNENSNELFCYFKRFFPESTRKKSTDLINLSPLDLDNRIFPIEDFRRCLNQVLVNGGPKILSYGDHKGLKPLREDLAHRMQIHGIAVTPEEILITNGAQQAIDLILKLFVYPGGPVAIESPTYANIIPLLRYYNADMIGIQMRNDGPDLEFLERQIISNKPLFFYTIPNFQNPTGITTSQSHRERLLSLCEAHKLPIVEDGFEEEMKYFGKVVLPIKSMDKKKVVIYLGTFSKVLFPGIRIGWIAAEQECIMRLMAIKRFTDLSSSTLVQAAVSTFLRRGYYDLHLKRMHRIFRKRLQVALQALKEFLPADVNWTKPDGGYTIWLTLSSSYKSEESVKNLLLKHGILVSPGEYYFHKKTQKKYFRISIASLNETEIEEGIARLGKALYELEYVGK